MTHSERQLEALGLVLGWCLAKIWKDSPWYVSVLLCAAWILWAEFAR